MYEGMAVAAAKIGVSCNLPLIVDGRNPSIKKNRIYDLATCQFIRDRRDVLLVPGQTMP
jgi:hypothetical protein